MNILAWIVLGAIAGYIAGLLVRGDEGLGVIGHIVLGIVGAIVGGFIAGAVSVQGTQRPERRGPRLPERPPNEKRPPWRVGVAVQSGPRGPGLRVRWARRLNVANH